MDDSGKINGLKQLTEILGMHYSQLAGDLI